MAYAAGFFTLIVVLERSNCVYTKGRVTRWMICAWFYRFSKCCQFLLTHENWNEKRTASGTANL